MERVQKKTMKQAAGDAPVVETTTNASPPTAKRRKSAAPKKVADPKMVEALEPGPVETAETAAISAEPSIASTPKTSVSKTSASKAPSVKTVRRGRPAKSTAAAKAPTIDPAPTKSARISRAPLVAQAKPAATKIAKAKTPKVTVAKKAPASKPAKVKPAAKVAAAKPGPSKGVVPLEAGAEIKLGFLARSVGFHLRLAQDASYRAFARHRDKDLIKPGRLPALAIIHLNPGISQSALGRAIARDKSTVSPLIKDLQKNGFISRKASTADRRSVTLALTKKGERTLDRLQARAQEHENEVDKIIGSSKTRLLSMLDKITTGMAP